jgi:propanediol dehydratase large subunit
MKKIIALTAALLIGMSAFVAAPAQASPKDDRMFYSIVTSKSPAFKAVARKQLVRTAKAACKVLRKGYTIIDVLEVMEESGFTERQSMILTAATIVFYCPEQKDNF